MPTTMASSPDPITLTYSTLDTLEIKLDAYIPPNATGELPGIIFLHGGGVVTGSRHKDIIFPMFLLGKHNNRHDGDKFN